MDIVKTLENLINTIPTELNVLTDEESNTKVNPDKWSKKEILGHVCDSATNNHYRFTKILIAGEPIKIEGYNQNLWVSLHGYQTNYSFTELITLWTYLNRQIFNVLKNVSDEQYNKQTILESNRTVTLRWLAEDYLNHTIHHINQLLERAL